MSAQDVKDNFISMNVCYPGPGKKDKAEVSPCWDAFFEQHFYL